MYGIVSLTCGVKVIIDWKHCGPFRIVVRLMKFCMNMAFEWHDELCVTCWPSLNVNVYLNYTLDVPSSNKNTHSKEQRSDWNAQRAREIIFLLCKTIGPTQES